MLEEFNSGISLNFEMLERIVYSTKSSRILKRNLGEIKENVQSISGKMSDEELQRMLSDNLTIVFLDDEGSENKV